MNLTRLGYIGQTTKHSVTTDADSFTVAGPDGARRALILESDVTVFVTRDGTTASADTGFRLPAGTPVVLNFFGLDPVSFIGESDGNLWVTGTDH